MLTFVSKLPSRTQSFHLKIAIGNHWDIRITQIKSFHQLKTVGPLLINPKEELCLGDVCGQVAIVEGKPLINKIKGLVLII